METTIKSKRGRKSAVIFWPRNEFTINELSDKFCRVTLQNHVNSALKRGEIVEVKQNHGKKGRPIRVFRYESTFLANKNMNLEGII